MKESQEMQFVTEPSTYLKIRNTSTVALHSVSVLCCCSQNDGEKSGL